MPAANIALCEAQPQRINTRLPAEDAELRLLLMAADPGQTSGVPPELADNLDWGRLLDMAQWHGLVPRLYSCSQGHSERVPPHIMERLYGITSSALALNMHLAGQLLALSGHFRSAFIPHIFYKGPLLASMLYNNLNLRISTDLDIIVPEAELRVTRDLLSALGFVDRFSLTQAQQAAAFRFGCEHGFESPQANVTVDLHWRVVPKYVSPSLDMEGIFSRVIDGSLLGRGLPTFCPEDLLFVLCLHAGQHEWANLCLLTDIVQVLRKYPQLHWQLFNAHLADSNTRRIVYVSLLLAQSWEVELPASVVAAISADLDAARIAQKVSTQFWPSRFNPIPKDADIRWLAERTAGQPLTERLWWFAGCALNPTLVDFLTFSLPPALIPLYPALRTVRLILKRTGLRPA